MSDETTNSFEKHLQSIAAVIAVSIICWVGYSIDQLKTLNAEATTELRVVSVQLTALKEQLTFAATDRYTRSQATSDLALRDARLDNMSSRVIRLERRHEKQDDAG